MNRKAGWPTLLALWGFATWCGALCAGEGKVSWLAIDSDSYLIRQAVRHLELPEGIAVKAFVHDELIDNPDAAQWVADSRLIIVDVMERKLSEYLSERGFVRGRTVYALRGSADDQALRDQGFQFDADLAEYFSHLSTENLVNLGRRAVASAMDAGVSWEPVKVLPELGVYHPDAPEIFGDVQKYLAWYESRKGVDRESPRLGLMFFSAFLIPGQKEAVDVLIRKLEDGGFSVIPAFGQDREVIDSFFLDDTRRSRVDLVLSYSLKFYTGLTPELAASVAAMDVPVFNAINLYTQTIDQWRLDPEGIPPLDVVWSLGTPEISGVIEPTPLSGKIEDEVDGGRAYRYESVGEQVDRLLPRLRNWAKLRRMRNADKKIAILYYNHSQGKQNIGASYLNVFRSLEEILGRLKDAGYAVPDRLPLEEKDLEALVLKSGLNIGKWAPGELDKMLARGGAVELPIDTYKRWFTELPADFRGRTLEQWGQPNAAAFMVRDGRIIIPVVPLGDNLVLLPEPARGMTDEPFKLYHDPVLYPHHQYIAAYLWLKHGFKADAMVHLGTHSTYEWLPGKQSGLSSSCPPEVMITDIPNIYPYIVDDVGEGLQAKRRGRGVVIDHLTPALVRAGGYHEYEELKELTARYEQAKSMDAATVSTYLEQIRDKANPLGIAGDLGLTRIETPADVDALAMYLEHLETGYAPYGMHTFGRSPTGDALAGTVGAIIEHNDDLLPDDITRALTDSGPLEMQAFHNGLSGRFVPPAEGNDPVRNPNSLPTGRNFYGFSPDRLPTPAAWSLGMQAADELIAKYRADNDGQYPEKVAVVVWAVETLRNEGVNEATVLSLIGMEPVWNPRGQVTGVRPIPASRLGRPRIDVVVNASGLYRDLFPDKIRFLDNAIRHAATQDDIENLIAKHDRLIRERLVRSGMAAGEAERMARARIFSEAPGAYGNRVSELVSASALWDDDKAVSDAFLRHSGFAYGEDVWGAPAEKPLAENLRDAQVAWHSASSNVYGLMDNDDMFMYLGGMSLAIRNLSGRAPAAMIAEPRGADEMRMLPLRHVLGREMRSRYLNPKWIEGMKGENYAGAGEMAHYVEYLWGWQATTPDSVEQTMWEQTYEVYVADKYGTGIKEFMDENNPWAYQSLTARMLEVVRKGYWQASDEVRRTLAVEYAMNVVTRGVACCDHTCNNPQLNQMVMNLISLPGLMSPELVADFKLAVEESAQKELDEQIRERRELLDKLGQSRPEPAPEKPSGAEHGAKDVKGLKMEPLERKEERADISSSGVEWFAAVFVMALLCFFFIGFRRR